MPLRKVFSCHLKWKKTFLFYIKKLPYNKNDPIYLLCIPTILYTNYTNKQEEEENIMKIQEKNNNNDEYIKEEKKTTE